MGWNASVREKERLAPSPARHCSPSYRHPSQSSPTTDSSTHPRRRRRRSQHELNDARRGNVYVSLNCAAIACILRPTNIMVWATITITLLPHCRTWHISHFPGCIFAVFCYHGHTIVGRFLLPFTSIYLLHDVERALFITPAPVVHVLYVIIELS